MKCPKCGDLKSSVVNSRRLRGEVLRRRKCRKCEAFYSTMESVVETKRGVVTVNPDALTMKRLEIIHELAKEVNHASN